jgi:hypothetical protein
VVQDVAPAELGFEAWNGCNNVVFPNGFASAAPGWKDAVGACLFKPLWLQPIFTVTAYYWIYVGNNVGDTAAGVGVTDGVTHWDITPAGGIPVLNAGEITGGLLNGIPVINTGTGPPFWWDLDTGNICTDLPGWPAGQTCKALRPFKHHLIAMDISDGSGDYPELVTWSSAANPGTIPQEWTPTPDNEAGNFTLATTVGAVIDGEALRDQFVCYKQHSTFIMQFIAGQFVFSQRGAFVTSGILARNCVAEMYGQHYVITDGDIIRHNGQEVQSLIDGRLRNTLFGQISNDTYTASHVVASHATKELWVMFPKTGHIMCDTAYVYDVQSDSWGISEVPEIPFTSRGILNDPGADYTWDGQADTWDEREGRWNQRQFNPTTDLLVMADYAGQRMLAMDGYLRDGAKVPVFLSLESKDFGQAQVVKLVTAIWNQFELLAGTPDSEGYFVRVGWQMQTADPITWTQRVLMSAGQFSKTDFLVTGRFLSFEISGEQETLWRLNSIDIDYALQGNW